MGILRFSFSEKKYLQVHNQNTSHNYKMDIHHSKFSSNFQVQTAQQQVRLSDSYLPVAMQIIHHLTDQMAFEVKDDPPPKSTTSKPLYVSSDYFASLPSSNGWWMRYGIMRWRFLLAFCFLIIVWCIGIYFLVNI